MMLEAMVETALCARPRLPRSCGLAPRSDHHQRQTLRRARPHPRLPEACRPVRLSPALGPHRGGDGDERDRRQHRRPRRPLAGGDRRYDPGLADAGSRRRSHRRGARRAADPAVHGAAELHAAGDFVPRLRPDDQHILSRDGGGDPKYIQQRMPEWRRLIPASRS